MNKWWDIKGEPVKRIDFAHRHHMRKWLESIPRAAIIGNIAYVIVYNSEAPERSYVVCEGI